VFDGSRAGQKIAANIYRPRVQTSGEGAKRVTLLLAHANGFHKELWEPSLEHLFAHSTKQCFVAEAVALDGYNHGDSAVLNRQSVTGETFSPWFLSARDILAVLSQLGGSRSVVGIGHSWGASSLLLAEIISPLSFAAIIATDPVLFTEPNANDEISAMTMKRRAVWDSESAARNYFDSHPFFGAWDARIRGLHIKHGLEPAATADTDERLVLKCRPDNEAAVYRGALHASPFTTSNLWQIQCPTAFLTGELSHLSPPQHIVKITSDMRDCTRVVMPGAGHLLVQEDPDGAADHYTKLLDSFAPKLPCSTANL
ncbi:hypothetical protein LPJ61_003519, partial [Coemansia biformis]